MKLRERKYAFTGARLRIQRTSRFACWLARCLLALTSRQLRRAMYTFVPNSAESPVFALFHATTTNCTTAVLALELRARLDKALSRPEKKR